MTLGFGALHYYKGVLHEIWKSTVTQVVTQTQRRNFFKETQEESEGAAQ